MKIKSEADIVAMSEGGAKLASVKEALQDAVKVGVSAYEIDRLAEDLIVKSGAKPSFKMVPGYHWTTCVNINEGIVHGIPAKNIIFAKGDVVSVDVGLFYKGFHTDTSFTVGLDVDKDTAKLLKAGQEALRNAIREAMAGNRIYDISKAIESVLVRSHYSPVRALVGHGVGKDLHEDPQIPCFTSGKREDSPEIPVGAVLAIEVMYSAGSGNVVLEDDGWTIATHDDTISALYEETVAVTKNGALVLTEIKH